MGRQSISDGAASQRQKAVKSSIAARECWMLVGDGTVRVGVNSAELHFELEKMHQCTQILHLPLALIANDVG
jgi:hypothetical protein